MKLNGVVQQLSRGPRDLGLAVVSQGPHAEHQHAAPEAPLKEFPAEEITNLCASALQTHQEVHADT